MFRTGPVPFPPEEGENRVLYLARPKPPENGRERKRLKTKDPTNPFVKPLMRPGAEVFAPISPTRPKEEEFGVRWKEDVNDKNDGEDYDEEGEDSASSPVSAGPTPSPSKNWIQSPRKRRQKERERRLEGRAQRTFKATAPFHYPALVTGRRLECLVREWNRAPFEGQNVRTFIEDLTRELKDPELNINLKTLNLRNAPLDDGLLEWICDTLISPTAPPHLERLALGYCELKPQSCYVLGELLTSRNSLTGLLLDFNQIGPIGARVLSELIAKCNHLTELSLHGNNIGDGGCGILCQSLRTNTSLLKLNLDFNNIGDDGTQSLVDFIIGNKTLKELSFNGNVFSASARFVLFDGLRRNFHLVKVHILYNKYSTPKFIEKVEEVMNRNKIYARVEQENRQRKATEKALRGIKAEANISFLQKIGTAGRKAVAEDREEDRVTPSSTPSPPPPSIQLPVPGPVPPDTPREGSAAGAAPRRKASRSASLVASLISAQSTAAGETTEGGNAGETPAAAGRSAAALFREMYALVVGQKTNAPPPGFISQMRVSGVPRFEGNGSSKVDRMRGVEMGNDGSTVSSTLDFD